MSSPASGSFHVAGKAWRATPGGTGPGPASTTAGAPLRSPTLLYWGDRDSYGGPDVARRLATVIPDARLDLVPEAGHLPWLDDPDHAAAAVDGHLRVAETAAHPSAPMPR